MSGLSQYLNKTVTILTLEGRSLTGTLISSDNMTNCVLTSTIERTFFPDAEPEVTELGLYIVRGESVAVCGLVDEEQVGEVEWGKVRVEGSREVVRRA
ncbi:hypothetical protein BJ508DRAFT_419732 [Ascobolus immersus RN42]|uniref:LSM2-LSM8 complex subunit LSM8 n=1 Tax=Ascobolus immersus RN42 TaxID=1160509 RepID=A0A3N4HQE5_ASCIM|nr:hypothetical protein BJ508DRAFT_419732 [Ascobolus immersus RN42]